MPRTVSDVPVVALAVTDGMLHYELSVAVEIFGSDLTHLVDPWYDFSLCGSGPVHIGRLRLEPDQGLDHLAHADTVIVPGWADTDLDPPAELVEAVRAAHAAGARVASLCTGAFVLGAAGLLDGRRATTHWAHTRELARRHPSAAVDPDVLYVDNGDVLTSAGKAAAMDLCLHLVRLDHGSANTNKIARRLVVPPHRDGGQAQFIATPLPAPGNHPLGELFPWVLERLDQPLTVEHLARQARMSSRHLGRHFKHPPAPRRSNGSTLSAFATPRNCWRPPTRPWTPSPPPRAWAPPPPCAATSTAASASHPTPTAAPSAPRGLPRLRRPSGRTSEFEAGVGGSRSALRLGRRRGLGRAAGAR